MHQNKISWISVGCESSRYMRSDGQTDRQRDGRTGGPIWRNQQTLLQFFEKVPHTKRTMYNGRERRKAHTRNGRNSFEMYRYVKQRDPTAVCAGWRRLHCTTHHQHPDSRYRVSSRRTIFFKGCTTFANVSMSVSIYTIALFRNGKIPVIIIGVDPAVDILDAILRACCSSSEQLWDSALLRQVFYWANSQNVDRIETKQGFPFLTFVLVTK